MTLLDFFILMDNILAITERNTSIKNLVDNILAIFFDGNGIEKNISGFR